MGGQLVLEWEILMGKIWDQWKASDWDNEMDLKK